MTLLIHDFLFIEKVVNIINFFSSESLSGLLNSSEIQLTAWVGTTGLVLVLHNDIFYQVNRYEIQLVA
jgi:hypothetical protein